MRLLVVMLRSHNTQHQVLVNALIQCIQHNKCSFTQLEGKQITYAFKTLDREDQGVVSEFMENFEGHMVHLNIISHHRKCSQHFKL